MVTDAFKAAQDKARGGADVPEPAQGTYPILPSALALGAFVEPGKLPQAALVNPSFPTKLVPPTQEDLLLLGGSRWGYSSVIQHWLRDREVHGPIPRQCVLYFLKEKAVREAEIVIKDEALQDLSLMAGKGLLCEGRLFRRPH